MFNSNIKMKKQERNRLWGASDKRTCAVVAWGYGWQVGFTINRHSTFLCVLMFLFLIFMLVFGCQTDIQFYVVFIFFSKDSDNS